MKKTEKSLKREMEHYWKQITESFKKLNKISQLILYFLMTLKDNQSTFGSHLLLKLFGTNARKNYLKKGIRNFVPESKLMLTNYINSVVKRRKKKILLTSEVLQSEKPTKPENTSDNLHKTESAFQSFNFSQSSLNHKKKQLFMEKPSIVVISELSQKIILLKNIKNVSKDDQDHFFILINHPEMESKYMEHWLWLYKYKSFFKEDFKKFDNLLFEMYLAHENYINRSFLSMR